VGDAPGFTNLSNRSDHGWTRSVHSNGHDLEPTRQGQLRLLRYSCSCQFRSPDHSVLALRTLVHQCRWWPESRRSPRLVRKCCNLSPHRTSTCSLSVLHSLNNSLQYLGVPLVAGVITRYTVWYLTSKTFLNTRFLPLFSPLTLLGLLYTILVMFAYQGHHILHNLGPVFRVFMPMILYFVIMWSSAFGLVFYLTRRESGGDQLFGYEMAVVQLEATILCVAFIKS